MPSRLQRVQGPLASCRCVLAATDGIACDRLQDYTCPRCDRQGWWWWWSWSCRLNPLYYIDRAVKFPLPNPFHPLPPLEVQQCRVVIARVALAAARRRPSIQHGLDRLERHHARSAPAVPLRQRLPASPASFATHPPPPTFWNSAPSRAARRRRSSRTRVPATAALGIGSSTGA